MFPKTVNVPLLKRAVECPFDCRSSATLLGAFDYLFWVLGQRTEESYELSKHFVLKRILGQGIDGVTVFEDYDENGEGVPFALKINTTRTPQPDYQIGIELNNLRLMGISSFILTYAQLKCPPPTKATLLCKPFGYQRQMIAMEYVPGKLIGDLRDLGTADFDKIIAILMISLALMEFFTKKGHGDLHDENVIIRPIPEQDVIIAGQYVVRNCKYLPVIIDYGKVSEESNAAVEIGRFLAFNSEHTRSEEIRQRALEILEKMGVTEVKYPFFKDDYHRYPQLLELPSSSLISIAFQEFSFLYLMNPAITMNCVPYAEAFVEGPVRFSSQKEQVTQQCEQLREMLDVPLDSASYLIRMSNLYDNIMASRYSSELCGETLKEASKVGARLLKEGGISIDLLDSDQLDRLRFSRK
ncbi:hypothetical protein Gasu2_34280 [Galdieria sulphuraria]|nr:hypothetical protein Gasu2_34280 [Galdieria sulphuraria]